VAIEDLKTIAADGHRIFDNDDRIAWSVKDRKLSGSRKHATQRTSAGIHMGNLLSGLITDREVVLGEILRLLENQHVLVEDRHGADYATVWAYPEPTPGESEEPA